MSEYDVELEAKLERQYLGVGLAASVMGFIPPNIRPLHFFREMP